MNTRQLFLQNLGQTSPEPLELEISRAEHCYLYDENNRPILDLIGGISVAHLGHGCEPVKKAIHEQVEKYLHVMVYGEVMQSPQIQYATALTKTLPPDLNMVYFTNSGAEAVEGAIKLAKRTTGKTGLIACHKSYHGSTTGALSLLGDEYWRNAFRPLMPAVTHAHYNSQELIDKISDQTAAVIIETVRAEIGVEKPDENWLKSLRQKCDETQTLLVFDEIQCGFARTGKLWAFENYAVVPDVLLLGKALGGGLPLGAFIARRDLMMQLTKDPVLGHITTFGGHPVSCAAGLAGFRYLLDNENILSEVPQKEKQFQNLLTHPQIKNLRTCGLLMAIELDDDKKVKKVLQSMLKKGVFSDWFLFAPNCIRLVPPLIISEAEIENACFVISECLNEL